MPQPILVNAPEEPSASTEDSTPTKARAEDSPQGSRKRKLGDEDAAVVEQPAAPAAPVHRSAGPILVTRIEKPAASDYSCPVMAQQLVEKPPELFQPTTAQRRSLANRLQTLTWKQIDELLGTQTADKVDQMIKNKTVRNTRGEFSFQQMLQR